MLPVANVRSLEGYVRYGDRGASMVLGLTGRRALVLAATRGLGRAIATALAAEGATVSICGRRDAERAAAEIARETGATVRGFTLDLHERSQLDTLLDAAAKAMDGIDILVLNGGGPPPAPALDVTSQAWNTWFERMVANQIYAATCAVPAMRERRRGDRQSTRLNSSHQCAPRMPSSSCKKK